MKKLLFTLLISIFLTKGFAQSSEIKPNQGVSVPQFSTAFINSMTNQPKGTVVFDSVLSVMKYFDGAIWQSMSGGGSGIGWQASGNDIINTNSGNVGIGMTAPFGKLEIEANAEEALRITQNSNSTGIRLYSSSATNPNPTFQIDNLGSSYSAFFNAGTINSKGFRSQIIPSVNSFNAIEGNTSGSGYGGWFSSNTGNGGYFNSNSGHALITGSGNVGIGTTNPIYSRLQINGGIGASVAMFGADKTGVSINADNPEVGLNYFFNGTTKTIKAGYAVNIGMYPNTGDFYIGNFNGNVSNADFGDIVGYQNVMTIKQNGNVGIGTTSPYNKFEVYGNSYLSGTSILSSPTNISAIVSNAADDGAIKIYSPNGFAGSKYITIDKESIQARRTSNAFPVTMSEQNLKLNPFGGNVGIGTGTTALTYKLEVNGTARTKEVIVETGWADYVFEDDYKLKSIDELEVFVKENKHLPNIPKASEIEANGLKVGETNKAMMEKIEELALYIIQLKKEIDVLKSKK